MRRVINFTVLAVLVMGMTLVSCKAPQKAAQAGGQQAQEVTSVKTFRVVRERISAKVSYTGTLEAVKKIAITPDIGGKIARINVREGDRVGKGQVLAEIDTEATRLQLKQAEAGLAVARAGFNDAKRNKERMDRLIQENAVSEQQYEQVRMAYDAADAQLQQAQAALNLAAHALDVSIMKAPWSGIIASKNAEVGDVINPMMGGFSAAAGVLTLMDFVKVKVVVDVSGNDVSRIRKGQSVLLQTPTFPGREFKGEVTIANLTADPSTKKFFVEAVFDNPGLELRPGTFCEVTFEVTSHESALVVPQRAVLENTHIIIVENGKAVKRDVTLGIQNTTMVEVLSGVAEGEMVVVEGNFGLEAGASVQITEEVKS
jgi:RND family efflux transporter MFP subunit